MNNKKITNLLNKLHPEQTDHKQAVNVEQISVIGHSCDAVGWRPVPYTVPERFAAFHANVEKDVTAFISKAHPDMYNVHFYEGNVQAALKGALNELEMQRIEHMRSIHNIRIYQNASKTDLESYLANLEDDLKKKEEPDG